MKKGVKNRPSKASLASVANYKFKANFATKTKHKAKPPKFCLLICLIILSVIEYLFYIVLLIAAKYPKIMTEILRSLRSLRMTAKRKPKTTKPALFALAFISFFVKFEFCKQKVFSKAEFKPKIYNFFEFSPYLCAENGLEKFAKNTNLNSLQNL